MAGYADCIKRLAAAAGRELSDDEVRAVYERVHQAAMDIRAGRVQGGDVGLGAKLKAETGAGKQGDTIIQEAAQRAAAELEAEAALREKQAELQVVRLGARHDDIERLKTAGLAPLDAVEKTLVRDYTGRVNVQSMEQLATGYRDYFQSRLLPTWDALGDKFLGLFTDREKEIALVKELRGEDSGDAIAKKGAQAFHTVAEEARQVFNANGGSVGRLDDWGMPQHHSQEKVAIAGREAWMDDVMPHLARERYVDEMGQKWDDQRLKDFMGAAWDTIATNGMIRLEPGKNNGIGARANRHAEERQIHFKDAESLINYWQAYGERTLPEILYSHVDTMARDVAMVEHYGPNPNTTYNTLRDQALLDVATGVQAAGIDTKGATNAAQGKAAGLDNLYAYVSGNVKPTYRAWLSKGADFIANLNVAGKLGGAMWASAFGDKPVMEAVSHMNSLPLVQRWTSEMRLLNPFNSEGRHALEAQGLMLEGVRSGLNRFYEGLGKSSLTGKFANGVMRITGMQAINDIRKGAFGLNAFGAIGSELAKGTQFAGLADADARLLRTFGITEADWKTWQLADLTSITGVKNVLTPESVAKISDADLQKAGVISQTPEEGEADDARRAAIVKLLGVVNTESDFAVVTPGWKDRAKFYDSVQRGTVPGEIWRSFLQFKAFPMAQFQRGMDAVANQGGPMSKAIMGSYLIASTTLAGAMIMTVRDILSGRDPLAANDQNWMAYWAKAFFQGGALGIYGDLIYGSGQGRYGSGPLETFAGPTIGPLLEMGISQPVQAIQAKATGKDTHMAARMIGAAKGFVPGDNIWFTKGALDHFVWQRVMEMISPGYLAMIRQKQMRDYNQDDWWRPGESFPDRPPDLKRIWNGS